MVNNPSVVSNHYLWDKSFDEENLKVRLWLDKLPTFTYAVRVHAQDLEEGTRLTSAREAHRRVWLEEIGISVEHG